MLLGDGLPDMRRVLFFASLLRVLEPVVDRGIHHGVVVLPLRAQHLRGHVVAEAAAARCLRNVEDVLRFFGERVLLS